MGTRLKPIGSPNYKAIAAMDGVDLVRVREYYIVRLVSAYRMRDPDTIASGLAWLEALTSEMRMRGSASPPEPAIDDTLVVP